MRRRTACGWAWCWCFGAGTLAAATAAPALPQRNLSVEARVVEQTEAERQSLAGGGSVVVDSRGGTTVQGGLSLRAGSDTAQSRQVQRVLVLNGGRATLRLSQLVPVRNLGLAWAGRTAGVAGSVQWLDVGRGLTVQPSWPGGAAPVLVEVSIDNAPAGDPTAERATVQTRLQLPIGEWLTVAELAETDSSGSAAAGAVVSSSNLVRSLQLRVTVP